MNFENEILWRGKVCNTPHPFLSTHIYWERERENGTEKACGREREGEVDRVWPAIRPGPAIWPGRFSHFRPPFWARLVPIRSLRDELRIHAVLVAGNWLERRWFEVENSRPNPFSPSSISSEFGHTSSWFLLLTSPASFSDQPRHLKRPDYHRTTTGKLVDFGASIRRRQRAWRLTATTVGLTEVWAIRPELPVAVEWIPVTVDRQGYLGNFTV